jgi:hypothetical protein
MAVAIQQISPVAHLPLVLGVIRKLNVTALIDTFCPTHPAHVLFCGRAVEALLLAILDGHHALYKVGARHTTTITLYGAYEEETRPVEGPVPPRPAYGHSKDGRDDLKQVLGNTGETTRLTATVVFALFSAVTLVQLRLGGRTVSQMYGMQPHTC